MESLGVKVEEETMLKAVFLPFISKSHLIFVVDIARLFAMHGVDVTIITTPSNAAIFQTSIDRDSSRGRPIRTHVVMFPQVPGLARGMESFNADTPNEIRSKIYQGLIILQEQFKQQFRDMKPDFIVTDMFYPWSVDVADELGIPRLICISGSYFAHSAMNSIEHFSPQAKVKLNSESFLLPGLPHKVEMKRLQLPDWLRAPNDYTYLMKMIKDSERKSYGSLFDSHEIESTYEEHYKTAMGTKSWSLGPVSLWVNQDDSDKAGRGHGKEEDEDEGVLKWLDSKKDDSVLYVSFGSMNKFPTPQLVEIAHALEHSGHDFIWVVRKIEDVEDGDFFTEFEKRMKESNKGYLIWGWAPQLLILEHAAVGAVVTHCGWNTIMESVNAGLSLATWPLFAEQFFNERLLVDVLKIGVAVGAKEWRNWNEFGDDVVKRDEIGKAIGLLMGGGEECLEMRKKAKALSGAAKKAIEVGGSSYTKLKQLIEELKSFKLEKKVNNKLEVDLVST
ncbi:putative soyasapogenol B glucuronide galactosyltransferase [Medicago truncatula]|uniref:Putative soyasapogenol B glucuronide galactosyltransferase n=1 Tax=Medicago truncatula TaxID=3880 RepID=A0A072VS84_MEDTR|nr:soyasapogenol B glucuronide galactosyltransferase [Medicago truncatula]KEH40975.1 UDP-glucosyltransferase family protein [Medicago truncatula]RHN78448.1 putative soyasapogenol B glucuronide galactosyltransferase [Medicago truncatula]